MKFQSISDARAVQYIEEEFGFNGNRTATRAGVVAEHIRAIVSYGSRGALDAVGEPVATSVITRSLRQRLSPLWSGLGGSGPVGEVDFLQEVSSLSKIGEIFKTDSYHWLAAPTKAVAIDGANYLLIGGEPCAKLVAANLTGILVIGRARIITRESLAKSIRTTVPVQRLEDWLQVPHPDVTVWGEAYIREISKQLKKVENVEGVSIFEDGFWRVIDSGRVNDGPQLFRRRVLLAGRVSSDYGLCTIRQDANGKASVSSMVSIAPSDARRLQGALLTRRPDLQRIRVSVESGVLSLSLPHPFPEPERKFLELGWLKPGQKLGHWPCVYQFSELLSPLLDRIMTFLGYKLYRK